MDQRLFIIGVNHRSAPIAVRERLAYAPDEIMTALERLKTAAPAIGEAALISTCNRTELIGVSAEPEIAVGSAIEFFAGDRAVENAEFAPAAYRYEGRDAARHLFRVGASLDSMVMGEPQILGQLKLAYAQAAAAGTAGLILHRAFHKAFSVAKRVRKATLIGHGAVSVSSAAVALADRIFDTLADKNALLIGAGRTAELTARQLRRRGVRKIVVTSRTFERAAQLAANLGAAAIPFDAMTQELELADIVVGSLTVSAPVLGPAEFERIARARHYRPLFLIDLGVPRNFDEHLNALENVYLYDIDDLGAVATENRDERAREAGRAEAIVELELDSFMRWLGDLGLVPAIRDIRLSIEQLHDYELNRHRGWLSGLAPIEQRRVESLTRGLANKLFHRILSGLRHSGDGARRDGLYTAELARRLLRAPSQGESDTIDALDAEDLLDDIDGGGNPNGGNDD
jgi:glutamyl-tRNA reductase